MRLVGDADLHAHLGVISMCLRDTRVPLFWCVALCVSCSAIIDVARASIKVRLLRSKDALNIYIYIYIGTKYRKYLGKYIYFFAYKSKVDL